MTTCDTCGRLECEAFRKGKISCMNYRPMRPPEPPIDPALKAVAIACNGLMLLDERVLLDVERQTDHLASEDQEQAARDSVILAAVADFRERIRAAVSK